MGIVFVKEKSLTRGYVEDDTPSLRPHNNKKFDMGYYLKHNDHKTKSAGIICFCLFSGLIQHSVKSAAEELQPSAPPDN